MLKVLMDDPVPGHAARQAPPKSDRTLPDHGSFVPAVTLAAAAGWVDAVGFVHWHGLFVSFMSGNTPQTATAVGIDWPTVTGSSGAILVFVAGVVLGELISPADGRWGRAVVLLAEALLLWLGAWTSYEGQAGAVLASILGLAMGIQNASVHEAEGIGVALTYVTGTLVKVGRGAAKALRGDGSWGSLLPYLSLWLGLLVGALGGGATARASEPGALFAMAVLVTALCANAAMSAARRTERG